MPPTKVLFCHGEERHELWGFILEKAFAKAHGCYENLMHGDTCEGLRDLTGGLAEKLQWRWGTPSTPLSDQPRHEPTATLPKKARGKSAATAAAVAAVVAPAERGGAGGGRWPRPQLAGWGLSAGTTTPPSGWVFERMRERLSEGQLLGSSRLAWLRDPWDHHEGQEEVAGDSNGSLFPPSNRLMRGLRSGVSYCVLEAFESGGERLLRLKDPWAGQTRGDEPGQYVGDWGPSSPLWSTNPALASELLERTFSGMFWMSVDAFLEI
ncbi:unnamed protein product, partial [Laminaria digitata]